jgi:hypothetical protein
LLAHEALACGADERHRLGEEHAHRVAERDRLLVGAPLHLDLRERGGGQLDGGVQRQRRELLALRLLNRLRLLLGELAQAPQEIFRVAAQRKAEAASFHVGHPSNVRFVAALVVVVLLVGCSAANDEEEAPGALSSDELAWIRSYVGWRVDFDRVTLAGGRAAAGRALAGCTTSLRRDVGPAPSARLRPVERLARRACAQWERYNELFHRFYDRNDFDVGPRMAAADNHADEASTRAFNRLDELLWESHRLPVVAAPSGDSRIQPRYARAANGLTARSLEIRCWDESGWERVQREAAAFEDLASVDVDGYASFWTGRVNLGPAVCDALDDLTYHGERPDGGKSIDQIAYALFVLAHETDHVAGVDDEAVATCDGLQNVARVARVLGVDATYAQKLALTYWERVYPREPAHYRTIACGPDRPLDRTPGDGMWP